MLGITFKENCLPTVAFAKKGPDIRNTKAIDIYHELREYDIEVDVYDPWANPAEVMHEYGIKTMTEYPSDRLLSRRGESVEPLVEGRCTEHVEGRCTEHVEVGYGAIVLAVAHKEFMQINLQEHKNTGSIIYDVKGILAKEITDGRL